MRLSKYPSLHVNQRHFCASDINNVVWGRPASCICYSVSLELRNCQTKGFYGPLMQGTLSAVTCRLISWEIQCKAMEWLWENYRTGNRQLGINCSPCVQDDLIKAWYLYTNTSGLVFWKNWNLCSIRQTGSVDINHTAPNQCSYNGVTSNEKRKTFLWKGSTSNEADAMYCGSRGSFLVEGSFKW